MLRSGDCTGSVNRKECVLFGVVTASLSGSFVSPALQLVESFVSVVWTPSSTVDSRCSSSGAGWTNVRHLTVLSSPTVEFPDFVTQRKFS